MLPARLLIPQQETFGIDDRAAGRFGLISSPRGSARGSHAGLRSVRFLNFFWGRVENSGPPEGSWSRALDRAVAGSHPHGQGPAAFFLGGGG